MNDDELKSELDGWKAPEPPPGMADRAWAQFEERRRSLWVRTLAWRVNLPLPAAVAAGLLLLVLGAASGAAFWPRSEPRMVVQPLAAPEPPVFQKAVSQTALTVAGFQPLPEIKPQIIRRK